jgi:hypothetical protein
MYMEHFRHRVDQLSSTIEDYIAIIIIIIIGHRVDQLFFTSCVRMQMA